MFPEYIILSAQNHSFVIYGPESLPQKVPWYFWRLLLRRAMRKCYVSYKTEDSYYAYKTLEVVPGAFLRAPGAWGGCYDDGRLIEDVREEILGGSEVTIHLIGNFSAERLGSDEQRFIKRELQASLCRAEDGLCSGVLGVVLPSACGAVFKGTYRCPMCGKLHERAAIDDSTVVTEFSSNYRRGCRGESGYCVLAAWKAFCANPAKHIERAFKRRFSSASKSVDACPAEFKKLFTYGPLKKDKYTEKG